ncbi:MAG TPA: hypothetical protein VKU87_06405 [Thermomicrobiaceae bacterium]|nr:hypothetical protein [Thermomicrobiaceae bacterium]
MAKSGQPSYTELVYSAVRASKEPISFGEIFAAVESKRRITSKNPKQSIRTAISQVEQVVNVGGAMFGFLPRLLSDTYFRLTLAGEHPESQPLVYPYELGVALWPSLRDAIQRQDNRPLKLLLTDGSRANLSWEYMDPYFIGSPMPDALRAFLADHHASEGDALLIHLIDAETGDAEAVFEPRRQRDEAEVARRNQELTGAREGLFRWRRVPTLYVPEITKWLLADGFFRDPMAPEPVASVLEADDRFVDAWYCWSFTPLMTPKEREALEEHVAMLEAMSSFTGDEPQLVPSPVLLPPPSPLAMRGNAERTLAGVTALLEEHDFETIGEVNAFLQQLVDSGQPPPHRSETLLDRAQDLIYEAWEASTPHKAVRLAKKALKESPDCADAYILLGDLTARTPEKAAEYYAQGVSAGERALGPDAFTEGAGEFWGFIETRPYMRARFSLAQALWASGRRDEAIGHLWEMLRLNPNDNQGVRYPLLSWLLEGGDAAAAERLLNLYPDDGSAVWHYGQVLWALRTGQRRRTVEKLLKKAIEWNSHVPEYLLGTKQMPASLPEYISWGDESEAIDCALSLGPAWVATAGALEWLAEHTS